MINLLNQTQYYFLFEVLECSWAEMLKRVNQAECLDDVIKAHATFLNSVQNGVLLDTASSVSIRYDMAISLSIVLLFFPGNSGTITYNLHAHLESRNVTRGTLQRREKGIRSATTIREEVRIERRRFQYQYRHR